MKVAKIIVSILLLFGFIISSVAQDSKRDSVKIYQYWAKRGIVEMVYAYMEDHSSLNDMTEEENVGMVNFKEEYIMNYGQVKFPNWDITAKFLRENGWAKTEENILRPLLRRYKDTVALDSTFFKGIINKPGFPKWDSAQNQIITRYQNQLAELSRKTTEPFQEQVVQQTPIGERQQEEIVDQFAQSGSSWTKSLFYLLFFLGGLFIGAWIIYLISKRKIYSIMDEERYQYMSELKYLNEAFFFKYLGLVYKLKEKYQEAKGDLAEKKRELDSALKRAEFKKSPNDRLEMPISNKVDSFKKQEIPTTEPIKPQEKESKIPEKTRLFFSIPEADGQFKNHNGVLANDGKKFYVIEFKEADQEGDLLFISSDKDKRAINRLEAYLKPVCDIENFSDAESATHITFISPGKVTLINDSWVIDPERKVKIKLV